MTAARECIHLEQTHALADGQLTGAAADDMRAHLATCAACQAELADVLHLDAAVADHRPGVVSLAWYRQRRLQLVGVALAAAAGVAIYLTLPQPDGPASPQVAVALAPRRVVEARLAWPGAAAHRIYDVPRASQSPHESIAMKSLAELEARGDLHGVGALALLNGERRRAADYLDRAGDSADVLSDRAALALGDHQLERALALADAAITKNAGHGPALWNRALALRDLGLSRAAAVAFREVARRGEPGWADEAQQRAAVIDAEIDALEQRFDRLNRASVALARGQIELAPDDARAMPGFARGILYDAIRSASTPEQLAALQPLAAAIDSADRGTAMADALARTKAALRPELSKQYGEMIRSLAVEMGITPSTGDEAPVPAGAARKRWLAALRAARADDLLIGVLMKTNPDDRWSVHPSEIAEFARLTAASPDPWMQILGYHEQAQLALNQDDLTRAEAILLQARQRCTQSAPAFRCIGIARLLGDLYLGWQRLPEARAVLMAAWASARSSGEWILQHALLPKLVQLASYGDDAEASGLPLVRAYTDEIALRYPESAGDARCQNLAVGRNARAMLLVNQLQFEAARRELVGPACARNDEPEQATANLFVRSEIARALGPPEEIAAIRREIAELRARASTPPKEQILLDHAEGRVVIESDPAAGAALLRRAIRAAKQFPPSVMRAHKAAAWSYSVLVVDAARRGDGDAALGLLAEEQQLTLPARCVLGVAIEDERRAIVARDAAGKSLVHHDSARKTPAIDAAALVPPELASALSGCAVVDVLARPPIHGMSRLLGDAIAWRYLSRRSLPVRPPGGRSIAIADVVPPAALELPRLATWSSGTAVLAGPLATPSRVLEAIGSAGEVVVHAHGIVDLAQPDASFLALSPDADGRFALTTREVRGARFATSPLVILAACRASRAAPIWHETWSLPAAFVHAGARAVIASAAPIPDADANAFFDLVRGSARTGAPVAIAVRDARQQWIGGGRGDWVRDVIVFE